MSLRPIGVVSLLAGLHVTAFAGVSAHLPPDPTTSPIVSETRAAGDLAATARRVQAAYRSADLTRAARLLAAEPRASSFTATQEVEVTARYAATRRTGRVELSLRLLDPVLGPRLVAIPPGTVARGDRALLLLDAPVVVVTPGAPTRLTARAAWVDLSTRPLRAGRPLTLASEPRLARLAAALLRARPADEAPAQLAVWAVAHPKLERSTLTQHGPRLSCTSRKLVLPLHAGGAARVLRRAGLSPRRLLLIRAGLPPLPRGVNTSRPES